ncbi:hypothetical protein DQE51_20365 [Salmonella enterica subsp. enterica]|nr:hypothetical protein [Salmonella enterica subsp. enterica serovar Hvittingfoss]
MASNYLRAYPSRAILLAILDLGSAQNPHVLRVRSGFCALSVSKLAAPITPGGIGSWSEYVACHITPREFVLRRVTE